MGFVFLSSVLWALLDFLRKKLVMTSEPHEVVLGLHLWQFPFFFLLALLPYLGVETQAVALDFGLPRDWGTYWANAIPSVVLNVVANLMLLWGLRLADLGAGIPMLALVPVFSAILSWFWLGEVLELEQWFGVGLVVLGALVLGVSSGKGRFSLERGVVLVMWVACLWSVTIVLDKVAVQVSSPLWHSGVIAVGITLGVWLCYWRSVLPLLAKGILSRHMLLGAFIALLAQWVQLIALELVAVAYLEGGKRELGAVGAVGLGGWFFAEGRLFFKFAMVLLMSLGLVLVLL